MKALLDRIKRKLITIITPIVIDVILDALEDEAAKTPTVIDDVILAEVRKRLNVPDND